MRKLKTLFLGCVCCLILLSGCDLTGTKEPTKVEKEIVEVQNDITETYKAISSGCIGIYATSSESASVGSGVVYKEESGMYYAVTNHHVIENMTAIRVYRGGSRYLKAELVGSDSKNDIAVIKFSLDLFGGSSVYVHNIFDYSEELVTIGQTVLAIGCPLGLENFNTLTTGVVSRVTDTQIQTNAEINPGNSGGGLFNAAGRLIGINTQKEVYTKGEENGAVVEIPVEGLGYAIYLDVVKKCIKDIEKRNGSVERPMLNITVESVNRYLSKEERVELLPNTIDQALVCSKIDVGVASEAGLKVNDVILTANDITIETTEKLSSILNLLLAGDELKLEIYRPATKEKLTFNITLK